MSVWDLWLGVLYRRQWSLVRKECNENLATGLARSTGSALGQGWGFGGEQNWAVEEGAPCGWRGLSGPSNYLQVGDASTANV